MFTFITKNQSIFLIADAKIERFNQIRQELELVTLASPINLDSFQIWNLLIDFWVNCVSDEKSLIEHPEHSLFYIVRKTIVTHLFKLPTAQRTLLLTKRNEQFAYLFSFYTLIRVYQHFEMLKQYDSSIKEAFDELEPYIAKDVSGYFDPSFHLLESYPKQFALVQTKAFRKINALIQSNQDSFNLLLQEADKEAKTMYYLLYDALI